MWATKVQLTIAKNKLKFKPEVQGLYWYNLSFFAEIYFYQILHTEFRFTKLRINLWILIEAMESFPDLQIQVPTKIFT